MPYWLMKRVDQASLTEYPNRACGRKVCPFYKWSYLKEYVNCPLNVCVKWKGFQIEKQNKHFEILSKAFNKGLSSVYLLIYTNCESVSLKDCLIN